MPEKRKKSTKGSPTKSRTSTKKKTETSGGVKAKTRNAEIKGIALIAMGIFLIISFFPNTTGVVGELIRAFTQGVFGQISAWFGIVFIIWMGINLFTSDSQDVITYKMWIFIALMLVISVIEAQASLWEIAWGDDGFFEQISELYEEKTGGVVGGLLYYGIRTCIGNWGTLIFAIAAVLILVIILTGISIQKVYRKSANYVKRGREKLSADLNREVVVESDKRDRDRVETKVVPDSAPGEVPNSVYFKEYFKSDVLEEVAGGGKKGTKPVKRFKFEEDTLDETQEIVQEIIREHNETEDVKKPAPFKLEDVSTGVLTELPDENGKFKADKNEEFEPPSMVQMEEKVDPLTQAAMDAGVPMDRAVEAGKRMSQQEVQQATNTVNAMAKESIEATKLLNYKLPSVSLLSKPKAMAKSRAEIKHELEDKANRLLETLASFKVEAKILNITQGPSVTRFELQPGFGIKVSKITNLADDIALSLAASGVRIEAPIPGKSAIGIEIPNETPTPVPIREVIDSDKFREFKSKTAFALGKDIAGNCVVADIASFPHVLIAGATGSGKSVCINSLITSILYKAKPNEVKMIMVDPKKVELTVYNGIPHLLIPVVTDPKHAAGALNWAVAEMQNRYKLMEDNKVRNLEGFNELMEENGTPENKLPEIIIIIDELADLMLAAKNEVEDAINRLAALARAAGMYLVIATQRPSVDVITGVIKANVPSRISFAVSSQVDSRTILDSMGAEKLLGKGDMLYAPRGATKPIRVQGNFLSDGEIEDIISYIKKQYEAEYDESIIEHIEREQEAHVEEDDGADDHTRSGEKDALFVKAAELAFESGQASVAMLQRRYKIGYQRAARIIDQLEENRIIGPYEGTKPRQVLITRAELNEMLMNNSD